MAALGSKRSTCWSITINNPEQSDHDATNNTSGWKDFVSFEGQVEKGENGTPHIQGMLKTKSVKFSVVKKYFPRAHIEIAKSQVALEKYVHKEDTRVSELGKTKCATVGDLNRVILDLYPSKPIKGRYSPPHQRIREKYNGKEIGICLLDEICCELMRQGYYGIEYICANPSVRTTWKKYWEGIVRRQDATQVSQSQDNQTPSQDDGQTQDDEGTSCGSNGDHMDQEEID